ncbi:MAG TPA: quaternary ammonium compound efflux SMR transporter SugE [Candidatus Binatia bacterium]|jgi:quaternary ammonium compound-resistance protein SugE|nr:quaternary ammonium compound efflux SMR transporter SugE [Candidatus Binatia bacterium]
MGWVYVLIAGVTEIVWAAALKHSDGFSRLVPSAVTVAGIVVSMACLAFGMRTIPIGTAYAVWTGIGAVGTALYGMLYFDEPRAPARLVCVAFIVAGVVGLRWTSRG